MIRSILNSLRSYDPYGWHRTIWGESRSTRIFRFSLAAFLLVGMVFLLQQRLADPALVSESPGESVGIATPSPGPSEPKLDDTDDTTGEEPGVSEPPASATASPEPETLPTIPGSPHPAPVLPGSPLPAPPSETGDGAGDGEPEPAESASPISGSFIQSWLVKNWSLDDWRRELSAMQEAGFSQVIIQSVVDLDAGHVTDPGTMQAHTSRVAHAIFPSSIPGWESVSSNSLGYALQAAQEYDMQVMIGLVKDASWWHFGWNLRDTNNWRNWAQVNAELNSKVISEIWDLYGEQFGDVISGFYYVNEIWNFPLFNAEIANILGSNIRDIRTALSSVSRTHPLAVSPFFNTTTSTTTAGQAQQQLNHILSYAQLSPMDILMPQDSVGPNSVNQNWPATLVPWMNAYANVARNNNLRFWINHENFTSDLEPSSVPRLQRQLSLTQNFRPEARVMFSWNHYWNPAHNGGEPNFNNNFRQWVIS